MVVVVVMRGSVLARWGRRAVGLGVEEEGRERERVSEGEGDCGVGWEVGVGVVLVLVLGRESRRGRKEGVKTPEKLSWFGVGGVGGAVLGGVRFRVGGSEVAFWGDREEGRWREGELGDAGEPVLSVEGRSVSPCMLSLSTPVVGLLSGARSREEESVSDD